MLLVGACSRKQETPPPPVWATEEDDGRFDLPDIQQAGELIALTLSGPDTYYDYHSRHLGVQYLMCEEFAGHLGVRLRMEVCRDTAELLARLAEGDADLAAVRLQTDSLQAGWPVGVDKPLLEEALADWYTPAVYTRMVQEEKQLLTQRRVRRRVYAPMLSKGVISHYDGLFKLYGRRIGWDWRLLAAQCYQESCFDPQARSWAGAQGLMQIMPATADRLGLPRDQLNDPEQSIAAATRYLAELEGKLHDVGDREERRNMALASYNGGLHHIRDAMRLAERDGRNPHRWADVRTYVLRLSQPQYYQDTLVRNGYMRGQETADYVDKIRQRYQQYRRTAR
ncbi:MAG: transglycosylase SLT domain-containing protein [Prevotella sp.]|nr:transglycosylase SLT domain-containing protein [Prevotella sp.]